MNESKRSEKCPLRDMPEKKTMDFREENNMYTSRYWKGYNSCIDEMLKETNGNDGRKFF